jgi:hypothetical protein
MSSVKPSVIDYLLIGLVYNSPGVPGQQIYQPILEDLYPRHTYGLLLGEHQPAFELSPYRRFENAPWECVTVNNLAWTNEFYSSYSNADILFSQFSEPEMNTDHDIIYIYGAYKVSEINVNPTQPEKIFCRGYNNINMEQLY